MSFCSCDAPQTVVDLTGSILDQEAKEIPSLKDALCRFGWSRVSFDLNKLPKEDYQHFHTFHKPDFVKLFDPDTVQSLAEKGVLYRGRSAESGSASADNAEPKQSLEVKRCSAECSATPLHGWLNAMHSIAVTVTKSLSLPPNYTLHDASCQGNCKQEEKNCNIDLLRVFLYDPAHPTLGSSEHTDWGGWTVVWQDTVGGLQAFCPVHERYVDVDSCSPDPSKIYFVVHVGDVTSLAMAHATGTGGTSVAYPSPKHQVVSPKTNQRVSLVYFAYPPPRISLGEIEDRLKESKWNAVPPSGTKVVYTSFYLLKNQSPGCEDLDPQLVYQEMRDKPLLDVFQAKWDQVQRNS